MSGYERHKVEFGILFLVADFLFSKFAVLCFRTIYSIILRVINPLSVASMEGSENGQMAVCGVDQ